MSYEDLMKHPELLEDLQLVMKARNGSSEALDALMRKYTGFVRLKASSWSAGRQPRPRPLTKVVVTASSGCRYAAPA